MHRFSRTCCTSHGSPVSAPVPAPVPDVLGGSTLPSCTPGGASEISLTVGGSTEVAVHAVEAAIASRALPNRVTWRIRLSHRLGSSSRARGPSALRVPCVVSYLGHEPSRIHRPLSREPL